MRSFQREALTLLSRLEASLAECSAADGQPEIDVSDLRVVTLQKELEAVSSDAAADISGADAPGSSAARPGADGVATWTLQEAPADSGDAATPAADTVLLLEAPPGREAAKQTQQASAAGPSRRVRTRPAQRAAADMGNGGGDPPHSPKAAPKAEKPGGKARRRKGPAEERERNSLAEKREGAAQQAGPGGVDAPSCADPSPPSGVCAVGRRLQVHCTRDGSWRAGKVTLFNRRSGKHSVQFEDSSVDVMNLAAERVIFQPEDEADEDDEDGGQADDEAPPAKGAGAASDAALGAKRPASAMVVYVPPSKRCAAHPHILPSITLFPCSRTLSLRVLGDLLWHLVTLHATLTLSRDRT